MPRAACIVVVLLAWVGAANAQIPTSIAHEPARPRGTSQDLQVSQFPERSTAGGLRYDLYCPHTTDANPLVVIALDVGEAIEHAEPIAHHFAQSGLIAVVVEPAPDRAAYPSRIGAVLAEVLAAQPLEAREPGCTRTQVLGAWGAGRGGVAVAELARTRAAAGQDLAAVVTVFAATAREAIPDMATPLLVIEGAHVPDQIGPSARSLIVPGGEPCDLSANDDPCRDRPQRPVAAQPDARDLRAQRTSAIYQRSRQFFRAYVDWNTEARAAVHAWGVVLGETVKWPTEEPNRHEFYTLLSIPLLLGGTNQGEGGFLYGLRPELVFARLRNRDGDAGPGFGFGLYGELLRWSGQTSVGAGVTFVHYLGGTAYAPSLGVATRTIEAGTENVVSAGIFLGVRSWNDRLGSADFPFGVRVDGRFGYGDSDERAFMVSACLDVSLLGILIVGALGGVVTN